MKLNYDIWILKNIQKGKLIKYELSELNFWKFDAIEEFENEVN